MKRRKFIKMTAIGATGAMLPSRYLNAATDVSLLFSPLRVAEGTGEGLEKTLLKPPSLITPNDQFYVLQIGQVPHIKVEGWRLAITGLVEKPIILSYEQIIGMTSVTTMRTLKCIGDPIGVTQMSNAVWTGVPMRDILQKVKIKDEAKMVVFQCADGYHTSIPIADALHEEALLAYKMNDEDLPPEHGFPVRFLNPGHYGTKNPKWIVHLELAQTHEGYWEKQGWDPIARVKLASVIGTPANGEEIQRGTTYLISGAAFDGGNHGGIKGVEVSVDDGDTWEAAEIWASHSPLTWWLWKYSWQVPENGGTIEIYARAIASDGAIQAQTGFNAEPAGVVGYHAIKVEVV